MTRKIAPADAGTVGSIEIALALLERARAELKRAGATKAIESVREAKKSAEGALRHARHRVARTPQEAKTESDRVNRAVIVLEVFGPATDARAFEAEVRELSLSQLNDAIDTGDWIGGETFAGAAVVDKRHLKPMMKAIGNDGTYFNGLGD